jgi:DNA-binding NarL/FixJ family response regulator
VFSLYSEEQYEVRALRAGAVAYLSKDRTPLELVDAVKRIVRGEMPQKPAEALVDPVLSAREMQVLKFFAKGLNPKDISRELGISAKTVGTYRFRLLNKLGVRNSMELMRYAVEEGLVDSKRA